MKNPDFLLKNGWFCYTTAETAERAAAVPVGEAAAAGGKTTIRFQFFRTTMAHF